MSKIFLIVSNKKRTIDFIPDHPSSKSANEKCQWKNFYPMPVFKNKKMGYILVTGLM